MFAKRSKQSAQPPATDDGSQTAQSGPDTRDATIERLERELAEQRGIAKEDAINMIVSGFCKEVFRELPMEFAVEAQKLLGISLEGSVG